MSPLICPSPLSETSSQAGGRRVLWLSLAVPSAGLVEVQCGATAPLGRFPTLRSSPPDTKEQFLHHFLSIPGQPGPCSSSPVPLRVLERTQLGLWGRWAGRECWLAGLAPAHSTLVPLLPTLMAQQAGQTFSLAPQLRAVGHLARVSARGLPTSTCGHYTVLAGPGACVEPTLGGRPRWPQVF